VFFSTVTYSDNVIVLKAFIITMMAVVALTIYTAQSTYDYSTWGARYGRCVLALK